MFDPAGTYVSDFMTVDLLERDAALAALGEAFASAARGEGRMVSVSGEPGIGKTSLVRRFTGDLAGGARPARHVRRPLDSASVRPGSGPGGKCLR